MPQIKVAANEVLNANRQFMSMAQQKLPPKASYTIHRLLMKLAPEVQLLDKKRNELIEELGEKDEESGQLMVKEGTDGFKEFVKRYTEVLDTEIEVECPKLDLDHLGDKIDLSPAEIGLITAFIKDSE